MQGYQRSDGRKGIPNYVMVAYLVECAHHALAEVVHATGRPVHNLVIQENRGKRQRDRRTDDH